MTNALSKIRDLIRRDNRGSAAVEFAIIAPVMILIFFGTAELSLGISANRKATLTARTISDLVARTNSVSSDDLKNVFTAATYILKPFPATNFKATVSAINIDSKGVATVGWKVIMVWNGTTATLTNTTDKTVGTVPTDLKVASTQLIKSDIEFPYTPGTALYIKPFNFKPTFFARPRLDSGTVACTTCS